MSGAGLVGGTGLISGTDRALVVAKPGNVLLSARPAPAAAPGETLVRPDLVGLCGTDLEIIGGQIDPAFIRYPIVLGHEWTGIVTGDSPLAGSRVVVEGIVACGHCARCVRGETNLCETYDEFGFTRDGAAAGMVTVPSVLVHPIVAAVPSEDAVLTEPGPDEGQRRPWQPGSGNRRRDDRTARGLPAAAMVTSGGRAARPARGASGPGRRRWRGPIRDVAGCRARRL